MTYENYLIYLAALVAFFATPPDTSQLLVLSNSISYGLRRSACTILGDLTANIIQIFAAAFGLAAVIAGSGEAFVWIKWFGVAYLVWIGVRVFRANMMVTGDDIDVPPVTSRTLFKQGFLTSLSNPFAIVFFGALFPQFIDASRPIIKQVAILGTTYLALDGVTLVLWGWVGNRAAHMLRRLSPIWVNRCCGALVISAAILLAMRNISPG